MDQMERLLNVATLLSAALIVTVLFSLRRAHIRVEYSVSWLAAGLVVLVLSRSEAALKWMGQFLGIAYPPAVLLSITVALFLLVLYRISMIISALKDNNIALAQKVAMLEYHIEALREGRRTVAGQ
jgi:hypothetical protein